MPSATDTLVALVIVGATSVTPTVTACAVVMLEMLGAVAGGGGETATTIAALVTLPTLFVTVSV